MEKLVFCIYFILVAVFCCTVASPIEVDGLKDDDDIIDLSFYGNRLYGVPSLKTGELVATWNSSMNVNPEEMGEYLEGDILHPPPNITKSGLINLARRWPGGVVPFVVTGGFTLAQRWLMVAAMVDIQRTTCIRFVVRNTQRDFVNFASGPTGCWSSVGRIGGGQTINLQIPGCVTLKGTVIHEILHALGIIHEHSRPERDIFVNILLQNVQPGAVGNFAKVPATVVSSFGVGYEYLSVMHYGTHAFSRNGQPTIVPRDVADFDTQSWIWRVLKLTVMDVADFATNTFNVVVSVTSTIQQAGAQIGQRVGLSANDIRTINAMYRC